MSKVIRGLLLLSVANFLAAGIGYVIHVALGRALGPEGYGVFNTINSLVSVIAILTAAGIPLAVSKYTAELEGSDRVLKKGLTLQSILAAIVFIFLMLNAEFVAGLIGDLSLVPLIRIAALGIPIMALYSVFDGFLNGNSSFGRQTADSIIVNIGKLFAIVLVIIGFGVAGALGGYVLGAMLGLIATVIFCWMLLKERGANKSRGNIEYARMLNFAIPIMLVSLLSTLLYNIDILSIKILLKSDELTGIYSAASMISRVPMLVFGAIATVLFPTLSYSMSKNEVDRTRKYISNTIRYLLILLLPMALIVGLTSGGLASLIYSAKYQAAGEPLSILFFGFIGIVFMQLFSTVINAEGKPMVTVAILLICAVSSILLNLILDPMLGIVGAATATTISTYVGIIIAGAYINKKHKIDIKLNSISKMIGGLALIALLWTVLNNFLTFKGVYLLIEYAILFGAYLLFLFIVKGYETEDLEVLYKLLPSKVSGVLKKVTL